MGQQAGSNTTGETREPPGTCCHCDNQIRPGARYCTVCGHPVEADESWWAPQLDPRNRHVRPLRVIAGVVLAVALAAGVIVTAHAFGHGNVAAVKSGITLRGTPIASETRAPSAGSPNSAASARPAAASTPPASPVTQRQAAANLAVLLGQSGRERRAVSAAFSDAAQCGPALSQDAETFQAAAASHRQFLTELAQLPGLTVLPSALRQDLSTAWQASASADSDYARWAQDQLADGCTSGGQSDPGYTAASAPNQQATASKTAFVRLWNPLAKAYGLPAYWQSDL